MESSSTQYKTDVPNNGQHTAVTTHYGMKYPDGTVKWGGDGEPYQSNVAFKKVADGDPTAQHNWRMILTKRAENAKIEPDDYIEGHHLIRRQFIVAVTEPEYV